MINATPQYITNVYQFEWIVTVQNMDRYFLTLLNTYKFICIFTRFLYHSLMIIFN